MASPKDPSAKEEEEGGKKLGRRKVCKLPAAAAGGLPKLHQPPSHFGPDTDRWESVFDLLGILRRLHQDECRRFRRELRKIPIRKGYVQIPEKALQEADASDLVELLFSYYGETYAVEVAADVLRAIGCEHQADELRGRKRAVYSSRGMQRNVGKKKVWSLEGVVITGEVMIRKGKKELLEIVEKDLGYFLHLSYSEFIITWRDNCVFQIKRGNSKEKSEKLLTMIQERGETTCCWFLEHVEKKHPGSIRILLYAAHGSGQKLVQASDPSVPQSKSPLFAEEGGSTQMENPAYSGESFMCNLCPSEDLPERVRPKVFLDSEKSQERYRLCFMEAGSFLCLYTDVIFEVRGAVTITYHFDSWPKHLDEQNMEDWVVAGPLINIEADPEEAVAAVHFPHFLCLAGKDGSHVYIAHFVEGRMSLEKPVRVGPYHVVLENPRFSPRGAILKTSWSWFKQKILIHTVALLYQKLRFQTPKFHLYLLPNDSSLRQAVHEYEMQYPSWRIEKPPGTMRPLTIGSCFIVKSYDARVSPTEVEFQYLDADKLQQYVELSAHQMQDTYIFSVMEYRKHIPIWEALVTQEELKSPERPSSPPHREQGACCCSSTDAASSSSDSGRGAESRAMKKTTRDCLVYTLENLQENDLKKFKFKLNEFPIAESFDNIPQGPLEKANALDLSQLLLHFYMEDYAVQVTADVLKAINCRDEAERLLSLTRLGN